MLNLLKNPNHNEAVNENEKENSVLYSAIKYREHTADYVELRNQVEQEYYHKVHGCSVREQESFT